METTFISRANLETKMANQPYEVKNVCLCEFQKMSLITGVDLPKL